MMKLDIDYSQIESNLQALSSHIGMSTGRIVKEEADKIMTESRNQVPTESGALVSTAFVEVKSGFARGEASFGYSGNAVNPNTGESVSDYMVAVHERLDLAHPNGKAKFLEDPVADYMSTMEETIGDKISSLFSSIFRR